MRKDSGKRRVRLSRRAFIGTLALAGCATWRDATHEHDARAIGYTQYRTNLPTRYDNQITARAYVASADGRGRRELLPELCTEPHTWTQFAGWSPDGSIAIIGRGWESPENGAWEEAHQTFRMTEGWRFDYYFYEMDTGALTNVTAVDRVSEYNGGVFFIPGDSNKLGFTALIDGVSHPFVMDRDGRNKRGLSTSDEGFTYGFSASPDGRHVAYHKDYQVYVADADGSNPRHIQTGNPFNFVPQWAPDGTWLLFVSGEHYDCHPHLVRPDGSELRKIADRGGYEGVTPVYDVYDFHGGSSDVPVWSADGQRVFYTKKLGDAVELMSVTLDGHTTQLTESPPNSANYHPKPSQDGSEVCFGSTRSGVRQLYVMPAAGGRARAITAVPEGHGAMWAHWRP